jgi:hypothetical protein
MQEVRSLLRWIGLGFGYGAGAFLLTLVASALLPG